MKKHTYKKILSLVLIFNFLLLSTSIGSYKNEVKAVGLGKVAGDIMAGYLICYYGGAIAASLQSLPVDMLSVPTNAMGVKQVEGVTAVKECGFNYAANKLKDELLHKMMQDTIQWVKGGYEGEPAFLTDPDQFLGDITDKYVGDIIASDERTKFLCDGFKLPYKFALNAEFYSPNAPGNKNSGESPVVVPQCTLSKAIQNTKNAFSDLSNFYVNGDYKNPDKADYVVDVNKYFNEFIKANSNSGNDIYSATLMTMDSAQQAINEENQKKLDDAKRGDGYMSIEQCYDKNTGSYNYDSLNQECSQKLNSCKANAGSDSAKLALCNDNFQKCLDSDGTKVCKYVTPGKVISREVSAAVGMERERLLLADDFDELLTAIINNLVSKVFDSLHGGLSGITDEDFNTVPDQFKNDNFFIKYALNSAYNPKGYDIEIKIYDTILESFDTEKKPIDILNEAEDKWKKLKDDVDKGNKKYLLLDNVYITELNDELFDPVIKNYEENKDKFNLLSDEEIQNIKDLKKKAEENKKEAAKLYAEIQAEYDDDKVKKLMAILPDIRKAFSLYNNVQNKIRKNKLMGELTADKNGNSARKGGLAVYTWMISKVIENNRYDLQGLKTKFLLAPEPWPKASDLTDQERKNRETNNQPMWNEAWGVAGLDYVVSEDNLASIGLKSHKLKYDPTDDITSYNENIQNKNGNFNNLNNSNNQ